MPQHPVELRDVIYNPATQAFESRAVVHDPREARSYACAVQAPITMDFASAADLLAAQALARHKVAARPDPLPRARFTLAPERAAA